MVELIRLNFVRKDEGIQEGMFSYASLEEQVAQGRRCARYAN